MSLSQYEKILATDVQDLMTRMTAEINRRNKGTDTNVAQNTWATLPDVFNVNLNNYTTCNNYSSVNSSLPSITSGTQINATDINKLVAELENINSDDNWSNATAVTAGNLITLIINITQSLERFENATDKISVQNIMSNYNNGIGSPIGNTSGCGIACRGLCQSCLGTATNSGSGGGCNAGCEGDCYGDCYGTCAYDCGFGCSNNVN